MNLDFNEIIDKYLDREEKARKIGEYHCSEIPYCLRLTWLRFKQPKKLAKETLRIFERGNVIHEFIAKVLASSEVVKQVKSEQSIRIPNIEKGFVITGRFDNFIELTDEEILVEIKTTRSLDYQKEASPHHIMQITPYLLYKQGLKGAILYIDANNFQTKIFEVIYDGKLMLEIMKRTELLHGYLIEDKMPPAEAKTIPDRNWECKYCQYSKGCSEIKDEVKL